MIQRTSTPSARRLGDFEIQRELGRGGMGIVYEARQVSLNRKVALKVLAGSLGLTSKAVIRFKREAEAAAKLHHTNIVPIYATGEHEGTYYYAMELIEGPGLDQVIAAMRGARGDSSGQASALGVGENMVSPDDPTADPWAVRTMGYEAAGMDRSAGSTTAASGTTLSGGGATGYFDRVAGMMADVADALDYAHAQGVIHRDIKPSNLLLSRDGRLHMNDFGLARMLEQPGMTVSGEFVGSPMYMSPEQIAVGRAPLDHRTDIYSLGATLYQLLTLEPPFTGQRRDQVIGQIIHKDPLRPRKVNRKVPQDLETICLKAMEKDPDKRYQSAGDMARDLRAYVNRFAISARRVGPVGRVLRWTKRHKAVTAALTCAAIALVTASTIAYRANLARHRYELEQRQARQAMVDKDLEEASRIALNGDYDRAEAIVNRAVAMGATSGLVHLLRGQIAMHRGEHEAAAKELEQAVAELPDSQAARATYAMALLHLWRFDQGYSVLREAEAMEPRIAQDYLALGMAESTIDPVKGLEVLDKAVELRAAPLVLLGRACLRVGYAEHTMDAHLVELALRDVAAARTILPPEDSSASATCLFVYLSAVRVYGAMGLVTDRQETLKLADAEMALLERLPPNRARLMARYMYLSQTGQEDAVMALLEGLNRQYSIPAIRMPYSMEFFKRGDSIKAVEVLGDGSDEDLPRGIMLPDTGPEGRKKALEIYRRMQASGNPMTRLISGYIPLILGRGDIVRKDASELRASGAVIRNWRDWGNRMLDYHCGLLSDEQLLDAAGKSSLYRCEGLFNIGLRRLAAGDRTGAADAFQKCRDTQIRFSLEYALSIAFLRRMDKDPLWPDWIPANAAR